MKKVILTSLMLVGVFISSYGQNSNITVKVSEIEKTKGPIYFMLYKSSEGFPSENDKAYKSGKVENYGSNATYTFKDVPKGEYAVAFYQDENNNGEMDSNFLGIPKESVGASNMTGFGKPSFKKSKFKLEGSDKSLYLKFVM